MKKPLTRILAALGVMSLIAWGLTSATADSPSLGITQFIDAQTGTTYTVACGDNGKMVTFNNAAAIAVTLPQTTSTSACFLNGFYFDVSNVGAGTATITPTTSTINGQTTYVVAAGQGLRVVSDGTNWQVQPGGGTGSVSTYWTQNLLTNGGFGLDQQYEGTGPTPASSTPVRVADRFFSTWVVSTSGAGNPTISQAAIAAGNTVTPKELKITANATPGTTSPAALNFITQQSMEGQDVADLQWGQAGAVPVTVSVWLKSSISNGVYAVYIQNGAGNRSYSHDCATSTTTWTFCSFTVAGDVTGTWNRTRDSIGMVAGVAEACGSTFQQTGDAWAGTTSNCTANQTELTNTGSATLEIAAFKVQRGTDATPFTSEPAFDLLGRAERFYRKSFIQGTAVAQNVGTAHGEACYQNPIAAGEGSITVAYPQMYNGTVTVTTYNPAAANANWRNETGSADVAVGTAIANTTNLFIPTGATVATIAHKVCINYTIDEGF